MEILDNFKASELHLGYRILIFLIYYNKEENCHSPYCFSIFPKASIVSPFFKILFSICRKISHKT